MFKNIIANYFGRFWSILSNFLFIPLYINILGFQNYTVISFTLVVAGLMAILDSGLTATLSREFSRQDHSLEYKQKVFRSLESIYIIVAIIIIIAIHFSSPYIIQYGIKDVHVHNLDLYIKILSFDVGFQMLLKFYMGGLLGLEKQIKANFLQVLYGFLRNGVVVLFIYFYPNLEYFLIWRAVVSIIFAIVFRFALSKNLNGTYYIFHFRIEKKIIQKIWKFAGGMLLISLVAGINTQLDKIIITKLISLESLGYYTLAVSLGMSIVVLVNPIATAVLPRFTALFSTNNILGASELYKNLSITVSVLLFTVSSLVIVFSKDLVWVWTGKLNLAIKTELLLKIICFGYSMLALQVIPYNISIANGYTKINNYLGLMSILFTIPGYWIVAQKYGVIGISVVSASIQVIMTFIYLILINNNFLHMKNFSLYIIKTIVIPFVASIVMALGFSYLYSFFNIHNRLMAFLFISCIGLAILVINFILFFSNEKRKFLFSIIKLKNTK